MDRKQLLKDYLVSRVISFGKTVDGYGQIYYKTNEDLLDTYLDIDFRDKDVLSVMASGDHVLTSDYLDARKTDAFDYNRLTLYYYYLRIWSIEYMNELYPKVLDGDNNWLKELLSHVKPRNEQEKLARNFFRQNLDVNTEIEKLFYDVNRQPQGQTLFTKASELTDCLNPEILFHHMNLFEDNNIGTDYDIVLISNILEWARTDESKLRIAKNNLSKLVRANGVVICSQIVHMDTRELETEKRIFESDFDFEQKNTGYIYTKKN